MTTFYLTNITCFYLLFIFSLVCFTQRCIADPEHAVQSRLTILTGSEVSQHIIGCHWGWIYTSGLDAQFRFVAYIWFFEFLTHICIYACRSRIVWTDLDENEIKIKTTAFQSSGKGEGRSLAPRMCWLTCEMMCTWSMLSASVYCYFVSILIFYVWLLLIFFVTVGQFPTY